MSDSPHRQLQSWLLTVTSTVEDANVLGETHLAVASAAAKLGAALRSATVRGAASGLTNATGDAQKQIDLRANELFVDALGGGRLAHTLISEELSSALRVGGDSPFSICFDPLDGSSNGDVGGSVGTIVGIYRSAGDVPQPAELISACYILYGPATLLVVACGDSLASFVLDEQGGFILRDPILQCPDRGHYVSANLGHLQTWSAGARRFAQWTMEYDEATRRPYALRYSGALVADVHRILLEGGIYLYPPDRDHPGGKLRLLYECAPLAFILERAGGKASDGRNAILGLAADTAHARVPLIIGSTTEMNHFHRISSQIGTG